MRGTIQTSKAGWSEVFIGWLSYSDVIFYGKPCVFLFAPLGYFHPSAFLAFAISLKYVDLHWFKSFQFEGNRAKQLYYKDDFQ